MNIDISNYVFLNEFYKASIWIDTCICYLKSLVFLNRPIYIGLITETIKNKELFEIRDFTYNIKGLD